MKRVDGTGGGGRRARELRNELSHKITSRIGCEERLVTDVPGLTLVRRSRPGTPVCTMYEPSVAVLARGRKRIDLGPKTFTCDPAQLLVTSLDLPVMSQVIEASNEAPLLEVCLKLNKAAVRQLALGEDLPPMRASNPGLAMATCEVTEDLLGALCRLLDALKNRSAIRVVSLPIEREIISLVLRGPTGARLRAAATPGDPSQRTAEAIARIRKDFDKPFRVDELAEPAGMGVSEFHRHFRRLTGMSPLQYQKRLRLQAARARMFEDGLDAARAAFEVGYVSAGQFSREYSRLFGQPPIRDIRNLRLAGFAP